MPSTVLLTEDARLVCGHPPGHVTDNRPSQRFARIQGKRILVRNDPEFRDIVLCPNVNVSVGLKPCQKTLIARTGYSDFVRIGGDPVCLDSLVGFTDGSPPGTVEYHVKSPGQRFVRHIR